MGRTEKEVEEKRDSKRRRPSEKDRNKQDEDKKDEKDKEEISESKKAKKSPAKTKTKKRGRPSGKDKDKEDKEDREDIPESRRVKRVPRKRVNLKRNRETKEKCIFCQEEYLRETLWEDVDKQQPNILQVSICKSCHACLKDDVVMKEIRETIKKSSCKLDEANKKAEYFCGMCQQIINVGFPTMVCTDCEKWIHKRCVSIPWVKAVENKHIFKCKNCEEKDDETTGEDDIEIVEDVEKHPEAKKKELGENKKNWGKKKKKKKKKKKS